MRPEEVSRQSRLAPEERRSEDAILVDRLRREDAEASHRFVGEYYPRIYHYLLWLTGRYDAEVYAISTRTGRLLARIPVGRGPHGLCVWPQPGRHSLGHTGILR